MYTVYCHTNKINGKRYVGITKQKPEDRWFNGAGYKKQKLFYNAIKKYGWHNFYHEILNTNLSAKEASVKEKELIALWKTTNKAFGYNIQFGGLNGARMSDATKKKLSEMTKKQMTPEAREYLRQCTLRQFATKGHPTLGHKCSDEKKEKIRNSHKFHSKQIQQYTLDGCLVATYPSLHAMERATGCFRCAVANYIKGKSNYCYGYHWKYKEN